MMVQLLTDLEISLLKAVLSLLNKVSLNPNSKMTSNSLAKVFAPTLLLPSTQREEEQENSFDDLSCTHVILQQMIDNVETLFDPPIRVVTEVKTLWNTVDPSTCEDWRVRLPPPLKPLDPSNIALHC